MKYRRIHHIFFILAVTLFLSKNITAQSRRLSLDECRSMALSQNKKIRATQYLVDAAKTAQKTANLNAYPSIDGSAMGIYLGKPIGGALKIIPNEMLTGSITATQPIYAGGKIKLGQQAAGKGLEIRQEQKALTESEVLLNADQAYWQVIQVKEKIVLSEKYKEMLMALRQDLKNSFDAGMIYKNDLLRVEVSLNETELNCTKAKDGLVLAKLNLAQIIGMAGNTDFTLADSIPGNFKEIPATAVNLIAENRPEIRLLKKSLEMEGLQKKIIKADLKPTIGLSASGLTAWGQHVNISNSKDFMASYYGIASISVPIFDWGKNASKVKEQTFKIASQQLQLDETTELINLEVQNAYLQLNESVKKIKLSNLSLQQAEENLRLANDRYKAGTVVGKDVLEAQAIWQQAYSSLIDAKTEYKIDEAALRKALGNKN